MHKAIRLFLPLVAAALAFAQEPAKPTVIKVGSYVQAANLVKKVAPEYPVAMKELRLEAVVTLAVLISTEGVPVSMSVQDAPGPSDFTDAAIHAVKQWRYRPTLLNGQPVDVMTTVEVNFTLQK